jgi:trimethylamine:corrinoid methyltransferase-like protein
MPRRNRRRPARNARESGLITQLPWKQLRYRHPPFELLSSDAIESIHRAGLSILQETGMLILSQQARQHYASAGFDLSPDSDLVRLEPG